MQLSNPLATLEPLRHEDPPQTAKADAGRDPALRCLNRDEIEFLDAAFDRILPGDGLATGGASRLDRRLWEASLPVPSHHQAAFRKPAPPRRSVAFYRSGIARVQSHCTWLYGRRFQHLPSSRQLDVLAQLEAGAGNRELHSFASTLLCDAVDAYFDLVAEKAM